MLFALLLAAAPMVDAGRPAADAGRSAAIPPAQPTATAAEAKQFVERVNSELLKLWVRQSTAEWIKSTYITDDTERNAAAIDEEVMEYLGGAVKEAARFKGVKNLEPDVARMLTLLRFTQALPAPSDPQKRSD